MGSSIQSQLGQPGGMNGTLFPGRRELFLPRIGSETAKGIQEMEEETNYKISERTEENRPGDETGSTETSRSRGSPPHNLAPLRGHQGAQKKVCVATSQALLGWVGASGQGPLCFQA